MIISHTKETLLAALEALRPTLTKIDKDAAAEHRKAEAAFLKGWRSALKTALGWSYEQAKDFRFDLPGPDGTRQGYWSAPTCPTSMISRLDRSIAMVKASEQKRYRIARNGQTEALFDLLTANIPKAHGLCDDAAV